MKRVVVAGFLTAWVVLGAASIEPPPFAGAVTTLTGVRLLVTLPAAHYGPGEPIAVYCTFRNTGGRAVALPSDPPLTALVELEGEARRFTQTRPCRPEPGPPSTGAWIVLAPGARWTTCLLLKPPRRQLAPGEFPLRVFCELGKGTGAPSGVVAPSGVLASEPVPLVIRYKVLWVG